MKPLEQFLRSIDSFLVRTGMKESRFGRLACNDPEFVPDLRNGREPRNATIEKVERFMAEFDGDELRPTG